MKEFDIVSGRLFTDLDTPYDKESNKIDVYSSVYWTAETKEKYEAKEQLINQYKVENDLFTLRAWCDISGFDYWVIQQEETNYVSIDVYLKKQPNEYSQEECQIISNAIVEADNYFEKYLVD
jgi:hypothetical protein